MKRSVLLSLLLAIGVAAWADQPMPKIVTVDPLSGKAGDVIAANGENLQKDAVAKIYLTDGKNDLTCEMVAQTDSAIKFKIPEKAPHGARLTVMVLTAGKDAKLIEQPVKVEIAE